MRKTLLFPIYVPTLILAFGTGMLVPILPLYALSFDISYSLVGLVLASQAIGNLTGDLPAGVLLGKIGQKWSMLVGLGTLTLAMLALSWAQSVPELILYSFTAGVGTSMWNISRHAYMTARIPLHGRGRATATFGGVNRIGTFVGPFVGGMLAVAYGFRAAFSVYAVFAAVALVIVAISVVRDEKTESQRRGGLRGHTNHLREVVKANFDVLSTAGIGQLLGQMIRAGRRILVPLFAADVLGLDAKQIGLIVTLSSAVDMSLFPVAGVIMDRYGRKYAYVPCFAIQGLGMALIPFTFSFATLLGATLIMGIGNGLGSGTMLTLGSDLAPKESMGEFLGVWRLIGDSGQTAAPLVVGSVADVLSLTAATFVIAGVGFGAALVLGLFVPETLNRRPSIVEAKA